MAVVRVTTANYAKLHILVSAKIIKYSGFSSVLSGLYGGGSASYDGELCRTAHSCVGERHKILWVPDDSFGARGHCSDKRAVPSDRRVVIKTRHNALAAGSDQLL